MYKNYEDLGAQPDQNRDIMEVVELSNSAHKQHVLKNNSVVCIDIYADWCGPCKQTAPNYAIVAANYTKPGFCAVVKYNLDRMDVSERAKIHGIPVFEFYLNGYQVDEIIGADIQKVEEKLKSLLQGNTVREVREVRDTRGDPSGPQYNRNSIRQTKSTIPSMENQDPSRGQPYQESSGNYYTSGNSQYARR